MRKLSGYEECLAVASFAFRRRIRDFLLPSFHPNRVAHANAGVGENFSYEGENTSGGFTPSVAWQPGLGAGLFEKSLGGPSALGGNLREEQTPVFAFHDQQTVTPQANRFRRDGCGRGKHGNFNLKTSNFIGADGGKSGIVQGGVDGGARDSFHQGIGGFHLANATAELAVLMKCYKRACRFREGYGVSGKIQNPILDHGA
jgi:hypothetical protein